MPRRSPRSRANAPAPASSFLVAGKGVQRRGINSVEIGLKVLRSIIELDGPATLKAIAERAGLDASQTHRYVSSLVNFGLVAQDTSSGRYALGPASLQIGLAAMAQQDAIGVAESMARSFSREHSVTTLLSLWGPSGPTIVRWYHGSPPVYTTLTIGSVLPLTKSATGRVFMSFLPDALLTSALAREGFEPPLARNPLLAEDRARIRAEFSAGVDGQFVPGLRVYASPLLGLDDSVVAVVATAHNDAVPRSADKTMRRQLVAAALDTSRRLGAQNLPNPGP